MDKLIFIYINSRVLHYEYEAPKQSSEQSSEGRPPSKKTKKESYSHDSWLVVDDTVEVDVEDDHLPPPEVIHIKEASENETDDEIDTASLTAMRTSNITSILS